MNDDKKKKLAAIIISKAKPMGEEKPKSEYGDESDNSMGLEAAAEELMVAIKSDDKSRLVAALRSMIQMLDSEEPEASEESES